MAWVQTASRRIAAAFAEVARAPSGPPDESWAHPEAGVAMSAWGAADVREGTSLRDVLASLELPEGLPQRLPGPWFGAASFAGSLGPEWDGFAPLRFTLPALLAWRDGRRHLLAAFGEGAQQRLDAQRAALDGGRRQPRSAQAAVRVVRRPGERARWNALVERALDEIRSGKLDKVVLARAIDVQSDAPLDPGALLAALELRYPTCRSFLLRGEGGAFLGATPEILCRVDGDRVEADALAGSAAPEEASSLASSGKDLREHRWVVEHIARALEEVADHIHWPKEPRVRALANVAHLHTPVIARLAPGRGVADVAAALHPTPAVGGVPSAAALRFLAEHEALDRGLYAGLVGWVGEGRAELAVALRSALVRGNRARLFVGSGIVLGSSPEGEWEETELKARALLDALGARP
jgi:menaquinone-specific isochorismate synthase